ncbi:hypothetical protein CCFV1_ORF051 [Cotesia congregata filamentous virus 1]|uniref:Uncharacterized protein n=1 Tax=Cotesia congregata filamentous virus 1 TaxID=3064291 RepID=A0ABC8QJM6_9VIRU|nr:hypothetical protein CCFV1_ORF051 [Cotesia congregata filamentous virus 1]
MATDMAIFNLLRYNHRLVGNIKPEDKVTYVLSHHLLNNCFVFRNDSRHHLSALWTNHQRSKCHSAGGGRLLRIAHARKWENLNVLRLFKRAHQLKGEWIKVVLYRYILKIKFKKIKKLFENLVFAQRRNDADILFDLVDSFGKINETIDQLARSSAVVLNVGRSDEPVHASLKFINFIKITTATR